ncbi:MAG: thioredoxin family protein [Bacteroidales bacterium]
MKKTFVYLVVIFSVLSTTLSAQNRVTHLTKADYIQKVHDFTKSKTWKYLGKKPAIIDFYAVWCGPCKKLSPIVSEIALKHPELSVYKIDVDEQPEIADYFNISTIPMLLYIPLKGKPKAVLGLVSKGEIEEEIANTLNSKK